MIELFTWYLSAWYHHVVHCLGVFFSVQILECRSKYQQQKLFESFSLQGLVEYFEHLHNVLITFPILFHRSHDQVEKLSLSVILNWKSEPTFKFSKNFLSFKKETSSELFVCFKITFVRKCSKTWNAKSQKS